MLSCKGSRPIPPGQPFPGHYPMKVKGEAAAQPQPGFGVSPSRQALSPTEGLSAPLNPQLVPNVPRSGQRRPPWALVIYPKCPSPAHCIRATCLPCRHKAVHGERVLDCQGNTLSSACKSFPATLSYPKPCFYLAPRKNPLPSRTSPLQKPKFSQRAMRYSYTTEETTQRSMFEQHASRWILSNYADKRDKKHIPADTWLHLHCANWLQLTRQRHWS